MRASAAPTISIAAVRFVRQGVHATSSRKILAKQVIAI